MLRFVLQNALLPAGFRQKDQTAKKASGPFDRERLLAYLEKQALEHKDREDYVPFTREKKGNAALSGAGVMKSLEWTSQSCCEPEFIEAPAAVMRFHSWCFQTSATVQRWDASCPAFRGAGLLCCWPGAQEGNETQRLQSSDGDGILKVRATRICVNNKR